MQVGRKILGGVFVLGLAAGATVGQAARQHPNLTEAQQLMQQAYQKIVTAQKDNHYDMQGHAEKAKQLIQQAINELSQAAGADDRDRH